MEVKIAENIRTQRKMRSLTQEQLAEAMGVTVGAVSKWEKGACVPDIGLIMELADFFETSVDVLLGYEWRQQSQNKAVEEIRLLRRERRFPEGIRAAEKALKKYPNSFEVVYQSAMLYSMMMDAAHAPRAVELFQKSCGLIDQNPYEEVSLLTIQNDIAMCYAYMNRYEDAIELMKKNNIDGMNNAGIGNLLSQHCRKPKEALPYLSHALIRCHSQLHQITLGLANAYAELGDLDSAYAVMCWIQEVCKGLRASDAACFMDKDDVRTLTVLAEISMLQGKEAQAYQYLKQAKASAEKFDSAPDYSMAGMRFYHGSPDARAYDDFGDTALEGIGRFIEDDEAAPHLRPIWKRILEEEG